MYKQAIIERLNDYAKIGLKSTYMPRLHPAYAYITIDGKRVYPDVNLAKPGNIPEALDEVTYMMGNAEVGPKSNIIVAPEKVRHTLKSRGRQLLAAGSIGTGAGIGGTAGYLGSNALSKYIGLKGGGKENDFLHKRLGIDPNSKYRKHGDIALRTLGTAGGAALGGYLGAAGYGAAHLATKGLPYEAYKQLEPGDKQVAYIKQLLMDYSKDDKEKAKVTEAVNTNAFKTMVNSTAKTKLDQTLFGPGKLVLDGFN